MLCAGNHYFQLKLPLHVFRLHASCLTSLFLPGHVSPPLLGAGLSHSLVLVTVLVPGPQVTEHSPNFGLLQAPQAPLTIVKNKTKKTHLNMHDNWEREKRKTQNNSKRTPKKKHHKNTITRNKDHIYIYNAYIVVGFTGTTIGGWLLLFTCHMFYLTRYSLHLYRSSRRTYSYCKVSIPN